MQSRAWLMGAVLWAAGCAAEPAAEGTAEEPVGPETSEAVDDGKSDVTELRVRSGATTLWIDKLVIGEGDAPAPRLVIEGRTSRDLASVHSWVPDDGFGSASIVSARKFVVALEGGHEVNTLLSGLPIYVAIETKTGSPNRYDARIRVAPRLASFTGSSKLHPSTVIDPVYVRDGENPLRYRGSIRSDVAGSLLGVATDEGQDPTLFALGDRKWQFDWRYEGLAAAALPAGDDVRFDVETASGTLQKRAELEFRVLGVSFTSKSPELAWPDPGCESEVADCILATPGDDLGACGSYRQVQRCLTVLPDAERFASDFSDHLVGWYAQHGADVIGSGGNTLEQALAAVNVASVSVLSDPEEDPYAHDLSTTVVFRHPDVAFPGSDIAWFGAYDRASGELLEIYDFN